MLKMRRAYSRDGTYRDLSFAELDLASDRDAVATFYGSYPPVDAVDHSITDAEVMLYYTPTDIQLAAEFVTVDAVRSSPI